MFVKINGRDEAVKAAPGSYLTLSRTWRDGDTIEVRMPFTFQLDHVMDQPNVASLFYGPVLLAAEEAEARTDWRQVVLDVNDISQSITGDPATLRFSIAGVAVQAVLRDVRAAFGLLARDVQVNRGPGSRVQGPGFVEPASPVLLAGRPEGIHV